MKLAVRLRLVKLTMECWCFFGFFFTPDMKSSDLLPVI